MAFNENTRVKIPALMHLERLGYKYISLKNSIWDPETNIFTEIFDESLKRLNPDVSENDLKNFKIKTMATLDFDDLGKEFFKILTAQNGIKVIDFENIEENSFHCVTELEYQKGMDSFRPDITVLINGLPLVFIEVKKPNNREGILAERNRIDVRLSNRNFKKIINMTQFMIFSNNMEYDTENLIPIQGAFYSTTSFQKASFNPFREELIDYTQVESHIDQNIEDFILSDNNLLGIKESPEYLTNKAADTPTNRILTSMISKERILFLLQYGITYAKTYKGLEKHIMRYPQLFATLAIRAKIAEGSKKGIIWHTQGSGKTALSFYNTKYLTDYFQKQNKIAKFYFIVDRIDLLLQAKKEFSARGLKVNTVDSKAEFLDDFSRSSAMTNLSGEPEITVVNIHKFSEEASEHFNNDYDLSIQRVYFIDEAHRSYSQSGSFLANLMSSDREAILICLTGTPLIGEFASKKIFGDYFHKYYYNASISDGYTLRLIREGIESSYSSKISDVLAELEIEKGDFEKSKMLAHKSFVSPMLEYITTDLLRSRMLHDDQTIGGMVVCDSSDQAREMHEQFVKKYADTGHLSAALILHDAGTKEERKDFVEEFKSGSIDLLFVFNMLLTGFDAPRLKKLYMGRVVREHNLLQALTRVNRPYKDFRYGYIVDFADIRKEFDLTNASYSAELKTEVGDEIDNYSNLFVGREEILRTVERIKSDLFIYDLANAEVFSQQISLIQDKKVVREVIASLEAGRDSYNLIRLLNYEDLTSALDFKKINLLLTEAVNHLYLLNLKEKVDNADESKMLLNSALEDVMFMFRKDGEEELRMGEIKVQIKQVREALERNIDDNDPEYLTLIEELRRILSKGNVSVADSKELEADILKLAELLDKSRDLNERNRALANKYGGDSKYVRIHKMLARNDFGIEEASIMDLLNGIRAEINGQITTNNSILGNRGFFEAIIERSIELILETFGEAALRINPENLKDLLASEYFNEYEGEVA